MPRFRRIDPVSAKPEPERVSRHRTAPVNPWLDAGRHALSLWVDAAFVIPLRSARIARGGSAAASEAWLMVSEKIAAAADLQSSLLTGRLGHDPGEVTARVMGHYARKVRANRRRLGG